MDCPRCKTAMSSQSTCSQCGYDYENSPWVIIKKVYPPDDIIVESFLKSHDIPVRLIRESIGTVQALSIGPLAEVQIAVPEIRSQEAIKLLDV